MWCEIKAKIKSNMICELWIFFFILWKPQHFPETLLQEESFEIHPFEFEMYKMLLKVYVIWNFSKICA